MAIKCLLLLLLIIIPLSSTAAFSIDVQSYNYNISLSGRTQLMKVLNLEAGDRIKILSSGQVTYTEDGATVSPAGDISRSKNEDWSCPSATPLSLYGRLGGISNDCFEIGTSYEFMSFSKSALLLGVNDLENAFKDNAGSWNIIVKVDRLLNSSYELPETYSFVVQGDTSWKDTLLSFGNGDVLLIRADGKVLCSPVCPASSPEGNDISPSTGSWPCPQAKGMSLIARIGTGPCFQAVTNNFIEVTNPGKLFFGVNDDYLGGNSGNYNAQVTLYKKRPNMPKQTIYKSSTSPGVPIINVSKITNISLANLSTKNITATSPSLADTKTSLPEINTSINKTAAESPEGQNENVPAQTTDLSNQANITVNRSLENISKPEEDSQVITPELYVKIGIILAVLAIALLYAKLSPKVKKRGV